MIDPEVIDGSLVAARRLSSAFVGTSGYALAYGSQVSGLASSDSDLDLLFVGPPLCPDQLVRLVQAVVDLHHDHGLRLDTEVAYEVKLHATTAEVDTALALRGFSVSPTGELHVPPFVVTPWFLNSVPFKLRLILRRSPWPRPSQLWSTARPEPPERTSSVIPTGRRCTRHSSAAWLC